VRELKRAVSPPKMAYRDIDEALPADGVLYDDDVL
jgi:hypothetical protein